MAQPEKVFLAAIDQGTSSTRAIIYNAKGKIITTHQEKLPNFTPHPGWVEQDPNAIMNTVYNCLAGVYDKAKAEGVTLNKDNLKGIGITNQRETSIMWDPSTGKPSYNAIVWSDTRNSDVVDQLSEKLGSNEYFKAKCGLPLSTYFSAPKIKWMLDNHPEIKKACEEKRCLFGTVDTWILWNLTGANSKAVHATDVTNASRTMLMNLESKSWDKSIADNFGIPLHILPEIRSSSEIFGYVNCKEEKIAPFSGVPIAGLIGDQQSALVGQLCFKPGDAKNTYGSGCFLLSNTGTKPVYSNSGLLTTAAYQLGPKSEVVYALEGSVEVAGLSVNWLCDNLDFSKNPEELEKLAASVPNSGGTVFVPAFSGLFAPHWKPDARGLIFGLTQHTTKAHIARACFEAVSLRNMEVIEACEKDSGQKVSKLQVDGGLSKSSFLLQIQSDVSNILVERPEDIETTAKGAAITAGLATGVWTMDSLTEDKANAVVFSPKLATADKEKIIKKWKQAIKLSYG